MEKDFIKLSKSDDGKNFTFEVYFSKVNSTVKIELEEPDFLKLVLESARLNNENTKSIKLNFSDTVLTRLSLERVKLKLLGYQDNLQARLNL